MNEETRDETYLRLRKQKHAAHAQASRLRTRLRETELALRLVSAAWIMTQRHNNSLAAQIQELLDKSLE
tara:strand:- start:334 stop:540 length:207 start_codon:yes stop_codon:yes gene_type:complete